MDIQRFNEPTIIKQLEQELENRNAIEKTSMTVDELRMLRNEHQHRLNILLHEITEDIKTKTGLEPTITIDSIDIGTFDEPSRVLYTTNIEIPI